MTKRGSMQLNTLFKVADGANNNKNIMFEKRGRFPAGYTHEMQHV